MARATQKYYIGYRSNPQLKSGGYYRAYGQLSKAAAARKEQEMAYGSMWLTAYDDEDSFRAELENLRAAGEMVAVGHA